MVYSYIVAFLLIFLPAQTSYTELNVVSGKVYQPKDKKYGYTPQYNRQQKLYRGTTDKKNKRKMFTRQIFKNVFVK